MEVESMMAPVCGMRSTTLATWCMEALSIITTERAFDPLKGCRTGTRHIYELQK